MSQANPFMITAVGRLHNFAKDKELYADELAVLKRKLGALKEAFRRHVENQPDKEKLAGVNKYILKQLHAYDVNLVSMNKYKNRIEVVGFMDDMKLLDANVYGEDVSQKTKEFLRYWENHALPGKQV